MTVTKTISHAQAVEKIHQVITEVILHAPNGVEDKTDCKAEYSSYPSVEEVIGVKRDAPIPINLAGRAGSTAFEDELIKPAVRAYLPLIISTANDALNGTGYQLIMLDAPMNVDEADNRTFDDMSLQLEVVGEETPFSPINIKITKGGTADNVGGWEAMDYIIHGLPNPNHPAAVMRRVARGEKAFDKKVASQNIEDGDHDYFLWVFKKSSTFEEILKSAETFSLLTIEPESLVINTSQSLPIQFNSEQVERIPADDPRTMKERRLYLIRHIKEKTLIKNREKVAANETCLSSISQMLGEE